MSCIGTKKANKGSHYETQCAELIFLPLAVPLPEFPALAMKALACQPMSTLTTIQLRENAAAIKWLVHEYSRCRVFGMRPSSPRARATGSAFSLLQGTDSSDALKVPSFSEAATRNRSSQFWVRVVRRDCLYCGHQLACYRHREAKPGFLSDRRNINKRTIRLLCRGCN
jgi:hypothetical protein